MPSGRGDITTLTTLRFRGIAAAVRLHHPGTAFVVLDVHDALNANHAWRTVGG